ncbi:MAG: PIG-L deacetylase family protein [Pseudomonadota bacterium]
MLNFGNTLVLAAHPDDEVLGVGGTIPRIKANGGRVTVVIVTDGSSTQYAGNAEIVESKSRSLEEANKLIGTDNVIQWTFPDMKLDSVDHVSLNKAIEAIIAERQFETVFVHNRNDINRDHQLIYESLLVATRPVVDQPVKNILAYQVNSATEWGGRTADTYFVPNLFVDISATIDTKLKALECYKDELRDYPHPRSVKAVRDRAAVYGSEVGYHYAEGFEVILSRVS